MKLGVVTAIFADRSLDDALKTITALGVQTVELPAGGYFPKAHCDPAVLLTDRAAFTTFRDTLARWNVEVCAFAIHGNPFGGASGENGYAQEFQATCQLAERLGVARLTLLAGLPPGGPADTTPNWVTAPFPSALLEMYRWQWEEQLIPYWRSAARIAENHGLRLCFEMVPADCVYNPRTLLQLRSEIGPVVGCNLDPSHLFFQGIDPIEVARFLGDAVYHVHAKDARLDPINVRLNGVLDPQLYTAAKDRAWLYRTVGYGHGDDFWANFVSTLRLIGYDGVVSIEHEDLLLSADEGIRKAVQFLERILLYQPREALAWGE